MAADDLFSQGFLVQDGFVAMRRVRALSRCAQVRRERGEFRVAGIGTAGRWQQREEIRGDSTCWLEPPLYPAERALLADLESLRLAFNRGGYLGLFDLDIHYAWYPPGAGYVRHVDQPQGSNLRAVSLILYLNEAWAPGAGGELRLYLERNEVRDIEPVAGRLVSFLSPGREHAVLPTRAHRLSVTGWFRRRG